MSDLIQICGLEVWACVGVTEKEREFPQRLLMNVTLEVGSTAKAARTDDIHQTIDYDLVWQTIEKICQEQQRKLIETVAEDVAAAILDVYPIKKVQVKVEKFQLPHMESTSVQIERTRKAAARPLKRMKRSKRKK